MLRRYAWVLALIMAFSVLRPLAASAAPMFPDVPDMWAKDAVAALAAKGILEGYPDGTFKGDRAATRYEVAMIVARLLAKMEQEHATFATKADLDELRRLVNQLKEELDALGVRVQNLEDNVAKLDKRVTELERITFYGSIDARFVSMSMGNRGLTVGTNGNQLEGPGVANGTVQVAPLLVGPGVLPAVTPAGATGFGSFNPNFVTAVTTAPGPGFVTPVTVTPGGSYIIPGTTFTTTVGVPMTYVPSGVPLIGGRPLAVNAFPSNSSSFNIPISVPIPHSSYNLVAGSSLSLGGAGSTASAFANSIPQNPFTGLTPLGGVTSGVPLVLPTFEVLTGRPWTNGTGFSGQGILGVRIKLNEDMDAGAEFAAYFGSGNPVTNAWYGVSANSLSNVFSSSSTNGNLGLDGGQGSNNAPWTRMNLDNFWFLHKPSNIKVQIGDYGDTHMDSIVYVPEYNPNYFGPRYLDNFGFRISGSHHLWGKFDWEVFGSQVADGNPLYLFPGALAAGATPYQPYLWGADLKWTIGEEGNQGRIKFDVLRIWDGNMTGGATTVGSIVGVNGIWTDWVNPNGFFASQLNPGGSTDLTTAGRVAGMGSTSDVRPIIPTQTVGGPGNPLNAGGTIFGNDAGQGVFGAATLPIVALNPASLGGSLSATTPFGLGPAGGSFGPQSMFTWGASGGWNFTYSDNFKLRAFAEYGDSNYKPSMNSAYTSPDGNAIRAGVGVTVFQDFDIDGEWIRVNPYYSPYVLQYPQVNGINEAYWRIPSLSWFPTMYPVSDKDVYPNNREGFRAFLKWNPVDPKDGKHKTILWGEYGNMEQVDTSLQSVRFSPGSADGFTNTPGGYVLGNLPGFIDTVFTGFSPSSFLSSAGTPANTTLSSLDSTGNQFATPLENPRGRVTNWGVGGDYRFDALNGLAIHFGYKNWQFTRATSLAPSFGGSENNINLRLDGGLVALQFPVNERFSVKGGYAWTDVRGHYDPLGIYRNFAIDTGNVNFNTFDQTQTSPFVGFDYDLARNVNWNMTAKLLDSRDHLGTFSTPNFYLNRNPFSWSGVQVTSEVKVSF